MSRPLLTCLAALVVVLMALPTTTAQTGAAASLYLIDEHDGTPLPPAESVTVPIMVARFLPPVTSCMEPEPIRFAVREPPPAVEAAAVKPVQVTPPATLFTLGGESWTGQANLSVRVPDDAPANQVIPIRVEAQGGGCAGPAGTEGATTSLDIALRVAYVGDVVADADDPQRNSDGTYVWTVRFQNQANGESVVTLDADHQTDGVFFLSYPASVKLPAPSSDADKWFPVNVVLAPDGATHGKAALRYAWGPSIPELGPGGEDAVAVNLADTPALPLQTGSGDPAADLPGFDVIPLVAALAAALLLLRRRR